MAPSPDDVTSPQFNPLGLDLLGRNLREEMDGRPRVPLDKVKPFPGAGLYALYYKGDLEIYEGLKGSDIPIYVGKASAGDSSYGDPPNMSERKLFGRIRDHRRSINEAANLDASHFDVRSLTIDDIWIVLGERALLRSYSPVLWNTVMTGFGGIRLARGGGTLDQSGIQSTRDGNERRGFSVTATTAVLTWKSSSLMASASR